MDRPNSQASLSAVQADEMLRFLAALSDLEEENGWISELEYALQQEELERVKKRLTDHKTWPPPGPN